MVLLAKLPQQQAPNEAASDLIFIPQIRELQVRQDLSPHRHPDDHLPEVRPGHCHGPRHHLHQERLRTPVLHQGAIQSKVLAKALSRNSNANVEKAAL